MSLHSKIGNECLPEEMASPNQLTSFYESFVLLPKLGPLVYFGVIRKLKFVIAEFASSIQIIDKIAIFQKKYIEIPSTPFVPDLSTVFEKTVKKEISEETLDIEEVYNRENKLNPSTVLNSLRTIGTRKLKETPVENIKAEDKNRFMDYREILSDLSVRNVFIDILVDKNLMLVKEGIVSKEILKEKKSEQIKIIIENAIKDKEPAMISNEVNVMSTSIIDQLLKNHPLAEYKNQLIPLAAQILQYFFDGFVILHPYDNIAIYESCEWAFVRKERITIDIKKPLFRGPLNVNCVAPKSELSLTETESRIRTSASQTLLKTSDDLKLYNNITSEVKNKLGTLFDYGSNLGQTMSEQGFSQDNMQSEKKSRVESALREISKQNSSFTLTSETISSSLIKEYRTEGKDPKFATSELSFEVFSPVEIKHYLEDIGAVWCPRIKNPFWELRNNLNQYYWKTYYGYINENYVIDPVEPIPSFEQVARISKNTKSQNDECYVDEITFQLNPQEIDSGYFFGEDIQLKFHQETGFWVDEYEEDDFSMEIVNVNRHGGDSRVTVKVKCIVEQHWYTNDPDWHYIEVSIDKNKLTDAYRQQLQDYEQTVNKINPARRNAIKVQARKYANLKREELIRKHESNIDDLENYAFSSLIKKMFTNNLVGGKWPYYQGIISSCIDWEKSKMVPEPCDVRALYANELSPYHFLNIKALRFFLTIKKDAEKVFFDTMRKVVDQNWRSLFDKVENYIGEQRGKFNELSDDKKLLDKYDSELILGRHLEAVLSNRKFSE